MIDPSKFFKRTLQLAARGKGMVSPNPLVGALLMRHGEILAEGWHQEYGGHHAEVNCYKKFKKLGHQVDVDTIMVVSLEPCAHFGQTPPCTDLIIKAGIKTVWVACEDPNPKVSGKGIQILKNAGVEVVMADPEIQALARWENRCFFVNQFHKRPYVILKYAQSNDGFISKKGETTLISNKFSQVLNHRWRSEIDGIMIGTNTALIDNPKLTNRFFGTKQPLRIVLDQNHRLPEDLTLFTDRFPTLVVSADGKGVGNATGLRIDNWEDNLSLILSELMSHGVHCLLVEGGAHLLRSFYQSALWDEARIITNQNDLHEGVRSPCIKGVGLLQEQIMDDEISYIVNPKMSDFLKIRHWDRIKS